MGFTRHQGASLRQSPPGLANLWDVDALFLANIVRPSYRLKQAVCQRTFLEGEYNRIRHQIEMGGFGQAEEVETEVHTTLVQSDTAFSDDRESFDDDVLGCISTLPFFRSIT